MILFNVYKQIIKRIDNYQFKGKTVSSNTKFFTGMYFFNLTIYNKMDVKPFFDFFISTKNEYVVPTNWFLGVQHSKVFVYKPQSVIKHSLLIESCNTKNNHKMDFLHIYLVSPKIEKQELITYTVENFFRFLYARDLL